MGEHIEPDLWEMDILEMMDYARSLKADNERLTAERDEAEERARYALMSKHAALKEVERLRDEAVAEALEGVAEGMEAEWMAGRYVRPADFVRAAIPEREETTLCPRCGELHAAYDTCQLGLQGTCRGERPVETWDGTPTCARCLKALQDMADENDGVTTDG